MLIIRKLVVGALNQGKQTYSNRQQSSQSQPYALSPEGQYRARQALSSDHGYGSQAASPNSNSYSSGSAAKYDAGNVSELQASYDSPPPRYETPPPPTHAGNADDHDRQPSSYPTQTQTVVPQSSYPAEPQATVPQSFGGPNAAFWAEAHPWDPQDLHYQSANDASSVDRSLSSWCQTPFHSQPARQRLPGAVCIPQETGGLQSNFGRAWAPVLAGHDINIVEFLAFIDHLNVRKASAPPMQVLSGDNGRVRMYIDRANQQFFMPRGLRVSIRHNSDLERVLGLPPNHQLLAPVHPSLSAAEWPTLDERRLQALQSWCAPLQLTNLPPPTIQISKADNKLQKESLKHTDKRDDRRKDIDDRIKDQNDANEKVSKELRKANEEIAKKRREADKEMREHPEKGDEIHRKLQEDIEKEMRGVREEERKADKDLHKRGGAASQEARDNFEASKLLWIVIQNVDDTR